MNKPTDILASFQGSSLPELLLILLLGGLLLTAVTPVRETLRRKQLSQQQAQLAGLLLSTVQQAGMNGLPQRLLFERNSVISLPSKRQLLSLPRHLAIEEARFGNLEQDPRVFIAYPNGTNSAGRLILQAGTKRCTLFIALRGAVRQIC